MRDKDLIAWLIFWWMVILGTLSIVSISVNLSQIESDKFQIECIKNWGTFGMVTLPWDDYPQIYCLNKNYEKPLTVTNK
jgi:hypothetical protein